MTEQPATLASTQPPADMLELAQKRVIDKLNAENPEIAKAIDPSVWLGLLTTVLEIIRDCQKKRMGSKAEKNAAVAAELKRVPLTAKLKLRADMIRKVGRATWRNNCKEIQEKFVQVAHEASDTERLKLVEQICN